MIVDLTQRSILNIEICFIPVYSKNNVSQLAKIKRTHSTVLDQRLKINIPIKEKTRQEESSPTWPCCHVHCYWRDIASRPLSPIQASGTRKVKRRGRRWCVTELSYRRSFSVHKRGLAVDWRQVWGWLPGHRLLATMKVMQAALFSWLCAFGGWYPHCWCESCPALHGFSLPFRSIVFSPEMVDFEDGVFWVCKEICCEGLPTQSFAGFNASFAHSPLNSGYLPDSWVAIHVYFSAWRVLATVWWLAYIPPIEPVLGRDYGSRVLNH